MADGTEPAPGRRRYDSPVRRAQVAATRERIVAAGAELAHGSRSWSWHDLTMTAVAERAGVDVRTVYRHFAGERELRDAVVGRLEGEAGVAVDHLELDDFVEVTTRIVAYLSTFAATPRATKDPTFSAVDERRRAALLHALEPVTEGWSDDERTVAAAALDVVWSVPTYERFTTAWGFDEAAATRAATWVVELLQEAVRAGRRP